MHAHDHHTQERKVIFHKIFASKGSITFINKLAWYPCMDFWREFYGEESSQEEGGQEEGGQEEDRQEKGRQEEGSEEEDREEEEEEGRQEEDRKEEDRQEEDRKEEEEEGRKEEEVERFFTSHDMTCRAVRRQDCQRKAPWAGNSLWCFFDGRTPRHNSICLNLLRILPRC
jgi:hypothetical protein